MAGWFNRQRTSTRLGFLLQIVVRILFSIFSLIWTPLLLHSMGKTLNGIWLSFQSLASLGGMGDLGMGGAINIQTSRLLGQKREPELRTLLTAARTAFLIMAVAITLAFLFLSPQLPQWLNFDQTSGAGSLQFLFAVGAVGAGLLILSSYFSNLNYGCGNLTWSIIPTFLLAQIGILTHWLLARNGFPLWIQCSPYLAVTFFGIILNWNYVRISHPSLAQVRELSFEKKSILSLLGKSFWIYFYSLGTGICLTTDRLLINAGFGAEQVPTYVFNYKLCELAMFAVISASLVSMPKIAMWLASPEATEHIRAAQETERLNKFQAFLGMMAALIYLAVNDWFMAHWLGAEFKAPFYWQVAFAANLAVTAAGHAGFDLAARCSDKGIRVGGISILLTALLNLGLSYIAMKSGSIAGIAFATVISQSCLVLYLGRFTSKHINLSWWRLSLKPWLLALLAVGLGFATKIFLPFDGGAKMTLTAIIYIPALLLLARSMGIRWVDLNSEIKMIRAIFTRPKN